MKIAFLNVYGGINHRGAESFSKDLASKLGKDNDVWYFQAGKITALESYKVISLPMTVCQPTSEFSGGFFKRLRKRAFLDGAGISSLLFALKAFPYLWREHFDVIRPTNAFWQVIICKIITFFRGGIIIIRGVSGPGWDERWNLYLKPDIFVATTPDLYQWAKKTAPWTRVEMIPLAVNVDEFLHAKPKDLNLERPIILCSAAADPYKRIDLAIRAVAGMKKGSLLHLGTGEKIEEIKSLGRELLGEKRFLSMAVPRSEVPGYFAACDVFTLPSKPQESFGVVFLEAMASGKIVVATDAPRPRWILGEAGIFVEPTDINQYTKALERAVASGKRKRDQIVDYARRFSWDNVAGEYRNLLIAATALSSLMAAHFGLQLLRYLID